VEIYIIGSSDLSIDFELGAIAYMFQHPSASLCLMSYFQ